MKTLKYTFSLIVLSLFFSTYLSAQVTIGSSTKPIDGALLHLKENDNTAANSNRGLLLPRVMLEKIDQLYPMFGTPTNVDSGYTSDKTNIDNAHTGLTVYNLKTDLNEGLCVGVYVWDSQKWIRIPEPCEPAIEIENSPNSFFVKPGEAIEIPVGKPYLLAQEGKYDLQPIQLTDKVTVELLWQDIPNLIEKVELSTEDKGPYSKFKVTTKSTSTSGNALVAVRMGTTGTSSDPIVWSWHIWVTDYDPNAGGTVYAHNNGEKDYVFMDRHLGATTTTKTDPGVIGLTYQWGRKDPFSSTGNFSPETKWRDLYALDGTPLTEKDEIHEPAGTGITHELASDALAGSTNNLLRSVQKPTTFFYGVYIDEVDQYGDPIYKAVDWYTIADDLSAGDNDLWGATPTKEKSAFDPCPEGWRVPAYSDTKSPWARFEAIDDGWGWGDTSNPYVKDDASRKGANFIANGSIFSELGYYPYSNFRRPRQYYIGGPVGSSMSYGPGGGFTEGNFIDNNARESFIWTANGNTNGVEGKVLSLTVNYSGLGSTATNSKIINYSKAAGAYVRCVKE